MSRDKKIHNLIEQQDNKGKQESWAKIQSRLEETEDESGEVENGNGTRAVIFSKKAILSSICAAALLITAILLIVLVPRKSDGDDFLTSGNEYSLVSTSYNIKNYAEQTGNNFLYFDWYDKTEYENKIIKSSSTDKIFGYKETVKDIESGYMITYYITDLKTNIDILIKYKTCKNKEKIIGTEVKWADSISESLATFEYKGFRYYLEIPECESPEILLGYVEQLLN